MLRSRDRCRDRPPLLRLICLTPAAYAAFYIGADVLSATARQGQRLAVMLDQRIGEQFFTIAAGAHIIAARDVGGGQDGDHARHGAGGRIIQPQHPPMRDG